MNDGEGDGPVIGSVTAMFPDFGMKSLGRVDICGAMKAFDEFPWSEYAKEDATRYEFGLEGTEASICFHIDDWQFDIHATDEEGCYHVETCLPRAKKLLGLFGHKFFTFDRASAPCVRKLLVVFFDPSPEVTWEGIEELYKNRSTTSPKAGRGRNHRRIDR